MSYKPRAYTIIDISPGFRWFMLLLIYSVLIVACFYLSYAVRFDFQVPLDFQIEMFNDFFYILLIKVIALWFFNQFGSMLRYFGLPDLVRLLSALLLSSGIIFVVRLLSNLSFVSSRGVIVTDCLLSATAFCTFRLGLRIWQERMSFGSGLPPITLERIAIVGAGDSGATLAKELLATPRRGFYPAMFFDDDQRKHGIALHGIKVAGAVEILPTLVCARGIKRVILAMPSAPHKRLREIMLFLSDQGYVVETLPALEELTSGRAKTTRIRPVEVEDLLGRDEVALDSIAIGNFINNQVVLVTGAGGSIGSELCRQIVKFQPKRLLMLDQSEPTLFQIEQEMSAAGMGSICLALVGDICDQIRMRQICERYRPALLYHAAAHKHVHLMERQPAEAICNNSIGTRQLAEIAAQSGTQAFIMVSTDKAINPTSLMGASKRLAEIHLQALHAQNQTSTKHIMVRFGNVLGSSGSVVPIFKQQIAAGGPVTVTHPNVTRYFMSIPEAAGLVLQASVLGQGGEIFVLDMGEPVKIVDLARQMIKLSGFVPDDDIEIKFTGLKPGEKLYEELQHRDERHHPTTHPSIMRFVPSGNPVHSSQLAIAELETILYQTENNELKTLLQKIIPEYTPFYD